MDIQRPHPTIGWSGGTEEHDVTDRYGLCTTCGGLTAEHCGLRGWARDQCRCAGYPEEESMQAYENRMPCLLCRACGLEVTAGHSKYRLLVCTPCRPLLADFNKQMGRKVLPQGIHSLVNGGPLLGPGSRPTREQVGVFANDLHGMFRSISAFYDWGTELVVDRLRRFGFDEGQVIPVEEYLARCRAAGIDRATGWGLLEKEWFADA